MKIVEIKKNNLLPQNALSRYEISKELEANHAIWAFKYDNPFKEEECNKNKKLLPPILLSKAQGKTKYQRVSFQQALKVPLVMGQCIGVIPLLGITNPNGSNLRFSRKTWIFYVCLFCFIIQVVVTTLCIVRVFRVPLTFGVVSFVLFYGGIATTTFLFMRISKTWPGLMKLVSKSEEAEPCSDKYVKYKCTAATVAILSFALIEHVLSIISNLSKIMDCTTEVDEIYRAYIQSNFPWLFDLISTDNSLVLVIFLQIMNIQAALSWNYSDLFIICVSFYLVSRLNQINQKLAATRGKYLPESCWRKLRESYNNVTNLIRNFDEVINGVIFVSFASNLYFICIQLFNTLSKGLIQGLRFGLCGVPLRTGPFRGQEHAIYYIFSLLFLLARSLTTSLIAASVHSASLQAAPALYDVPSPVYCKEVQRFLDQIHGDCVALTGLRFFKVTRGLVLSVAGTIVTYELVLMQFNRDFDDVVNSSYNNTKDSL